MSSGTEERVGVPVLSERTSTASLHNVNSKLIARLPFQRLVSILPGMRSTLTVLLLFSLVLSPSSARGDSEKYRLIWNDDPATTMVVGWNQLSGTNESVHYGLEDHGTNYTLYTDVQPTTREVVYRGMDNRFAKLAGLTPGTNYYFVVRDTEGWSDRMWFKTAPNESVPVAFVAGGDSRSNPEGRTWGNRLIAKIRPLFIVHGGDYVSSGTDSEWDQWLDEWQLTKSPDGRMYPLIPAHGNHENNDRHMVYNVFNTPNSNGYFALTVCSNLCRVYTLNTELEPGLAPTVMSGGDDTLWDEQADWLKEDMKSEAGGVTWKIANYHRPIVPHRGSKSEGGRRYEAWADTFFRYGMDIAVECDSHLVKHTFPLRPASGPGSWQGYVRSDADGTLFTGEGSWGAPTRDNDDDKPWTMASARFWQFKLIHMDASNVKIRTVRFDYAPDQTPYDPDTVTGLTQADQNANPFAIPDGLDLWNPPLGKVVTLPFTAGGLAAPSNLVATNVTATQIDLGWNDSSSDEDGFVLFRKVRRDGIWRYFGTNIGVNAVAFSDKSLSPGTVYSYRLAAVSTNGFSAYSNELTVKTPVQIQGTAAALQAVSFSVNPAIQFTDDGGYVDFSPQVVGGTNPITFLWDFGDGESTNTVNPGHMFSGTGMYDVVMTVTDGTPGTMKATNTVRILPEADARVNQRVLAQSGATLAGHACLLWEAEDFDSLAPREKTTTRWGVISDSHASFGLALRSSQGNDGIPGVLANAVAYKLRFTTPGDYYFYFRGRGSDSADGFSVSMGSKNSFYTPDGGLGDTIPGNSAYGAANDFIDNDGTNEAEELKETYDWYYFMDDNSQGLVPLTVAADQTNTDLTLCFGARDNGMVFDRMCLVQDAPDFGGGITTETLDAFTSATAETSIVHSTLVGFQAEHGTLGSNWTNVPDADALGGMYTLVKDDMSADNPSGEYRVATYSVKLPKYGVYDLYARMQCTDTGNSLFYADGFGTQNPASDDDWIKVNVLDGSWFYWYNVSQYTGSGDSPVPYTVTNGPLTRVVQMGGREPTRIDAYCFGLRGEVYTDEELDAAARGPHTTLIVK